MDTLRLDQTAREQLIQLKRRTGIKTWNVLCRWALASSLQDSNVPASGRPSGGTAVEMDWHTFTGPHSMLVISAVIAWLGRAGMEHDERSVDRAITSHVHRGIAHLAGSKNISSVEDLWLYGAPRSGALVRHHQ
jgi:DNA sulfur modification protein DndE